MKIIIEKPYDIYSCQKYNKVTLLIPFIPFEQSHIFSYTKLHKIE